jgi:flavin reductase (DIM6/NTAB) family NADH-FMN oxidoreductase RutF
MRSEDWLGTCLDVPMFIVTAASSAERAGCLVGFTSQCSVDPIHFMVFLSDKNRTYRVAQSSSILGVHAVPRSARALAELFGGSTGDDVDKFERCSWRAGPEGVPILEECDDWFVGRVLERRPTGDHVGFLLEPLEGHNGGGAVMGFQSVKEMEPGHGA